MTTDTAMDPVEFYDSLVVELTTLRASVVDDAKSFGGERMMEGAELIEWLSFQAFS